MPMPTSRLAYKDIFDVYEAALEDPKGIRLPFATLREAQSYRIRLHQARAVDRRENKVAYTTDDPMYGQSQYDILQVKIRHGEDDTVFLYIEPRDKTQPEIESLTEIEGEDNDAKAES